MHIKSQMPVVGKCCYLKATRRKEGKEVALDSLKQNLINHVEL